MSDNIFLSVIIPVLNNCVGFTRAITSIIQQPNRHTIEIIVIDGGSIDGTVEEIKRFGEFISYWETGIDVGICDAFNRGINQASGYLIAILNSDDYWMDNTLDTVLSAQKTYSRADIYYGAIQFVDKHIDYRYRRNPDLKEMKHRMSIFHPSIFVKKSAYNKIGLYDDRYHLAMDSEWCHRAMENNLIFQEIPYVLASMELGGLSDLNFFRSLNEYRKSLIHHGISNPWFAWLNFIFYVSVKLIMRIKFLHPLKKLRDRWITSK